MEEDVLRLFYPGMKFEADVMKFNVGDISFLDRVNFAYPSFYLWTLNERIEELKNCGEPKEWMKRQNEKHFSDGGGEMAEMDEDYEGGGSEVGQEVDEDVEGGEEREETAADEETPD